MTDLEKVQLEIVAIKERLSRLVDDGEESSAAYTRWILAHVIKHAGDAMLVLSSADWTKPRKEPSDE